MFKSKNNFNSITINGQTITCSGSNIMISNGNVIVDVCMLSSDLHNAVDNIKEISERTGVFIDTDIRCKKWSSKVSNYRGLETR